MYRALEECLTPNQCQLGLLLTAVVPACADIGLPEESWGLRACNSRSEAWMRSSRASVSQASGSCTKEQRHLASHASGPNHVDVLTAQEDERQGRKTPNSPGVSLDVASGWRA